MSANTWEDEEASADVSGGDGGPAMAGTWRELDALVAEKVMGDRVLRDEDGPYLWLDIPGDEDDWTPLPAYSTTWEGMRLVVEKMRERLPFFSLEFAADGWVAEFDDGSRTAQGLAATAPHACALAALRAMDGEPSGGET